MSQQSVQVSVFIGCTSTLVIYSHLSVLHVEFWESWIISASTSCHCKWIVQSKRISESKGNLFLSFILYNYLENQFTLKLIFRDGCYRGGVGGGARGAFPPTPFWPLMFFIANNGKNKLEKCQVLKTEIEIYYRWLKKSLNKTSSKSHNCNKFNLYNRHQITQRLCFSIRIMGKNFI